MNYRFILQPYKGPATRFTCPQCHKRLCFVRYIDTETNHHIADHVGRCNREVNCAYHYKPKQYFTHNPHLKAANAVRSFDIYNKPNERTPQPPATIPIHHLQQCLKHYEHNHFVQYLINRLSAAAAQTLVGRYCIGTSRHWQGAVVFPQIDVQGQLRQLKIMDYNPQTGKRVKSHQRAQKLNTKTGQYFTDVNHGDKIYFAGKQLLNNQNANLVQCFFGEHLLPQMPGAPVLLVESEKTALIGNHYYPQAVWLATGGKNGCRWADKHVARVLTGRRIILLPDLNAYHHWQQQAQPLNRIGASVTISHLENYATPQQIADGLDWADFITSSSPITPAAPLSPADAFARLCQKNPALLKLQQRLGLVID